MTGEDIRELSAAIDRLNETLRTMYMVKAEPAVPAAPIVPGKRCVECGAIATAPHSPNCPNRSR